MRIRIRNLGGGVADKQISNDADPDPDFPDPTFRMRIRILPFNLMRMRIRNLPLTFSRFWPFNTPRLPPCHFDADPDPTFH